MKIISVILLNFFMFGIAAFAQGSAVKLTGQVVCCEDCWTEKDRTKVEFGTAEDLLAAKGCVEGGDPTLLAVREGDKFKLYQLAQGKFRLTEKNWYSYIGKKIEISGSFKKAKGKEIIEVNELKIVAASLAEQDAAKVLGTEIELKLKDLFGAEQSLTQHKGKIVVLNFWATYCAPCLKEMPDLAAIQNEFAAFGVQVVGASADEAGERAKVLQFIKDLKINFPVWIGASSADTLRFGVGTALPATIIINRDGKVYKAISGVINQADLRKDVEKLLAGDEKTAQAEAKKQKAIAQTETSSVPS